MTSAAVMESISATELLSGLGNATFNAPNEDTKIYKDECMYCFNTPFFPGGLFVSLENYCSFCPKHVKEYASRQQTNVLFVQIESKKIPISMDTEDSGEPKDKITRLAIGADGGFDNQKFEIEDSYNVVVYPELHRRSPVVQDLGADLYLAAEKVITSMSAERMQMLQTVSSSWDGEVKQITKNADLIQLDNGKKVACSGWKCEEAGCSLTENLWLNLTDGAIRCGRSQYISEGQMSIGNNHMKQYYDATGFPLIVKLGTISKDGVADVFSYDEDDAVIDPNLEKHLAHFGLDPATLEKTEQSTLEMELDLNQKWEYSKCLEDGAPLEPIFGSGYTGINNIGNSCYINSVVQSLLLVPSFVSRFAAKAPEILSSLPPTEVHSDFNCQVAKLASSLMSGAYSLKDGEHNHVSPKQFKRVVAGNHPEFMTAKQQDAEEFVRHFLDKISSNTPADQEDPAMSFRFAMETRFEDIASARVRYSDKDETLVALPVIKELLTPLPPSQQDPAGAPRSTVSLNELIQAAFSPENIEVYTSPVTGESKGATTTRRFKTFPDFLFFQVQRFHLTPEYTVKKIDLDVQVDDVIDLTALRGTGKKENEELLPEDAVPASAPTLPQFDNNVATQLEQMGFSRNASMKAAMEVHSSGGSAELALEWLMVRLEDPSLNDAPLPIASSAPVVTSAEAAAQRPCVQELVNFGFSVHQACFALEKFPDANAAAEWLFEHADEVPPEGAKQSSSSSSSAPAAAAAPAPARPMIDGDGQYSLVGLITHMGANPHSGHYVAHLIKDGKWIQFNDEKVAISQNPPKELAYLYLYKRI